MLHEIQTMWTEKFGMVHWAQVDFGRYQNPGHLLDKLIERHQADAVILLLPTDGWSGPALERRPVFQFGGLYQTTLPYSLCSYEINKEVKQAVHHLAQVGHRKILIPRNDQHTGDVLSQCLEETLSEFGEHGNMEKWCPVFPEKEASAWNRYWKKSLMELNPTAVIVADDIGLLSLYGFCSEAGIHIPRGLSVISLSYDERLSWMRPKPTMMRFPADKALTLFEEWLENDFRPIGKNFLNLQMIAGDSIAEPNH
ncbi:MAG: substrate-binding domain-containing protein [Akkermansiaceae bacterium]